MRGREGWLRVGPVESGLACLDLVVTANGLRNLDEGRLNHGRAWLACRAGSVVGERPGSEQEPVPEIARDRMSGEEVAVLARYEIQGRRTGHDAARRTVRDETRLASASTDVGAFETAADMVTEGFTVWVFETARARVGKSYRLLKKLDPSPPAMPRIVRRPQ